ncbi:PKD domain-containing protein [Kribbella sp. WER1]
MSRRALRIGIALALIGGLGLAIPGTALATDDKAADPPDVTAVPVRDGLQAGGEERISRRRPNGRKSNTTEQTSNRKKHPVADPPPRDSQRDTAKDDLKLNIGICGRVQPDGTVPGPTRCQVSRRIDGKVRPNVPPKVVPPKPQDITWEEVRSETKNVVFPGLSVKVQPEGKTLVNMATIVYTDDSKVSTTTVTLLGFPVVVEATPISYTWNFGDGSATVTTTTPGKPYPSADITHKYSKRQGVGITVTTNYAARFNVADTGWQYIEGTVPITGPATLLQVREAVPVLVDPGR